MTVDLDKVARRIASVGQVRTAGKIEFVKDTGPLRRDIRVQGFKWSPDSLRDLAKILWAVQRGHSYAMSALRLFSKMPSSEFSPDGLLGGRGYIQNIRDMRGALAAAVESMSTFSDTLHDEVNATHWSAVSDQDTNQILNEAETVKQSPEKFVEQSFQSEGNEGFEEPAEMNPNAEDLNPHVESHEEESEHEEESSSDGFTQTSADKRFPNYEIAVQKILDRRTSEIRVAASSLPEGTIPTPRMNVRGPAEGSEAGHYNREEVWPSDDPIGEGFSQFDYLLEDGLRDGVVGEEPTSGDDSVYKAATGIIRQSGHYSWLPGSANEKSMNYYDPNITDEDLESMKANNAPDPPPTPSKPRTVGVDPLWKLEP